MCAGKDVRQGSLPQWSGRRRRRSSGGSDHPAGWAAQLRAPHPPLTSAHKRQGPKGSGAAAQQRPGRRKAAHLEVRRRLVPHCLELIDRGLSASGEGWEGRHSCEPVSSGERAGRTGWVAGVRSRTEAQVLAAMGWDARRPSCCAAGGRRHVWPGSSPIASICL